MTGLMNEKTEGVFIISATPFSANGEIDYGSADRLVEFYIGHGVSGMTILGMMGEAPKLSTEESDSFMRHVIRRVGGRIPVVVGVSDAGPRSGQDGGRGTRSPTGQGRDPHCGNRLIRLGFEGFALA